MAASISSLHCRATDCCATAGAAMAEAITMAARLVFMA